MGLDNACPMNKSFLSNCLVKVLYSLYEMSHAESRSYYKVESNQNLRRALDSWEKLIIVFVLSVVDVLLVQEDENMLILPFKQTKKKKCSFKL